jgi:tetratricopeptide (TPR) repeat protein
MRQFRAAWVVLFLLGFIGAAPAEDAAAGSFQEVLEKAQHHSREGEWAEAAKAWAKVVELNPVYGPHWHQRAQACRAAGDYRGAVAAFEKVLELGTGYRWQAAYNIACCHAKLGDKEAALRWLRKAMDLGHRNPSQAYRDDDLALMRDDASFRALVGMVDPKSLTRDEGWRTDLKWLAREIRRKHFDPYKRHSREEFDAYVRKLHDDIPKLSDAQVQVALVRLAAMAGDGHTYVRPAGPMQMLPVQFYQFTEGVFITAAAPEHADLAGAQVLRIGDHDVQAVQKAVEPLVSHDNPMGFLSLGVRLLTSPQLLHGLGLLPYPDKAALTVRDAAGKERIVTVPAVAVQPSAHGAVTAANWVTARRDATRPVPLYLKNRQAAYWFEHVPEHKLVYFQYNGVRNEGKEPLEKFCERLFKFINENDVEKLVIDLRWNGGGNSFLNRPIIHGLIRCEKVNKKGKLFAVIGRQTFSAAQNCTTDLEMHTNVTFVGEPSGSSPNFIGESVNIRLPFSGMTGSISDLYWVRSWPMDYRIWIAPQLYAPPSFALYKDNRDPALEAILAAGPEPAKVTTGTGR